MAFTRKTTGITGINGKTGALKILQNIFKEGGFLRNSLFIPSTLTEKPSLFIKKINSLPDSLPHHLFLELSFKSFSNPHLKGLNFDLGAVSNLSWKPELNHMNKNFYNSCVNFFKPLREGSISLFNADDPLSLQLADKTRSQVITYALEYPHAMVTGKDLKLSPGSSRFKMVISSDLPTFSGKIIPPCTINLYLPLPGKHNIYNALLSSIIALIYGVDCKDIVRGLSCLPTFNRNLEVIFNNYFTIIDDRADNPGALEGVLETINLFDYKNLLIVFSLPGYGGPALHSLNGQVLTRWSHKLPLKEIIVTSSIYQLSKKDRASREGEKAIIKRARASSCPFFLVPDLTHALETALARAEEGDLILLLGKKGMEAGASLCKNIIHSLSGFAT
ncbi:MAG: hypothetical protein D5R97_05230 [Candidatus Syntrophonatronum acetioxidans]|uniref:Uncharacterized protein n=1 Tax=Candidatus Syntrophonatronum acetioxidans TaxID=1795816 RepID=A0A424YEL4_9FIRM|nr:MAG: hypothetical protein D5R97_05230 [Candidatus Syntrophonatronum acetioxidans]